MGLTRKRSPPPTEAYMHFWSPSRLPRIQQMAPKAIPRPGAAASTSGGTSVAIPTLSHVFLVCQYLIPTRYVFIPRTQLPQLLQTLAVPLSSRCRHEPHEERASEEEGHAVETSLPVSPGVPGHAPHA